MTGIKRKVMHSDNLQKGPRRYCAAALLAYIGFIFQEAISSQAIAARASRSSAMSWPYSEY